MSYVWLLLLFVLFQQLDDLFNYSINLSHALIINPSSWKRIVLKSSKADDTNELENSGIDAVATIS